MRLPPFLTEKPLIGAVLDASDVGAALLGADVDRRNDQLSYRTADEGLRRWERDLSLPSDGDAATRRARIYAALTGGRTLTVEELEKLALTLTDAQQAVVTEKFDRYQVILSALFDGEAGDLTALRAAVERRRPAHLDVRVQSTLPAREIVYYGLATPLSVARTRGNGVSAGGFALYGGGLHEQSRSVYDDVDAYDAQLVRTLPLPLLSSVQDGAAAMAGEMAVFAGGASDYYSHVVATPTAYSPELTRSAVPGLSTEVTQYIGAVGNGFYAVFGGGENRFAKPIATVVAVNDALVSSYPEAFSAAHGYYGAAKTGESILFAGGYTNADGYLDSVDAYGSELEKLSAPQLPMNAACPGSAEAGEYAVFAGGESGSNSFTDTVCAYSPELTRTVLENLSAPRNLMHSVAFQGSALFAGGKSGQLWSAATDCYDEELVHTVLPDISIAREEYNLANGRGAAVGNYALICGGQDGSQVYDTVDVFTIQ